MTIKQIIEDIIAREGGYVNHPNDKGGPTNHGITGMSYGEYFKIDPGSVRESDIRAITPMLAEKIYMKLYYVRPGIIRLPEPIKPILLDMAVNHGPATSINILQKTLQIDRYLFNGRDGIIGEKTISASNKAVNELGVDFINDLVDARLDYYKKIIARNPSQAVFEDGWLSRAESFRVVAV